MKGNRTQKKKKNLNLSSMPGPHFIGPIFSLPEEKRLILPLSQEYEDSGEFTFKQRMLKSIKINLIIYAIGAFFGFIWVVYLLIQDGFKIERVLEFFVVLSNTFGLVIVVFLMGYGLATIPKQLFRERDNNIKLKKVYFETFKAYETYKDIKFEVEELALVVVSLKKNYQNNIEYSKYFDQIANQFTVEILTSVENQKRTTQVNEEIDKIGDISITKLADLNKKSKTLQKAMLRSETKWKLLSEEALFLEDVIENKDSTTHSITSSIRPPRNSIFGNCLNSLVIMINLIKFLFFQEWYWYQKWRNPTFLVLCIITGGVSLLIILAEDLNVFNLLIIDPNSFAQVEIFCFIPILYVLYCIQYGLLSIRISMVFGFYNHQHTDATSLIFASTFISRISFPLAFNFLWMFKIQATPLTQVAGEFNYNSYLSDTKIQLKFYKKPFLSMCCQYY